MLGQKLQPDPIFYPASELAHRRMALSKNLSDVINDTKKHDATKTTPATQLEILCLLDEIRSKLEQFYKSERERTLEIFKNWETTELEIDQLFTVFLKTIETSAEGNHALHCQIAAPSLELQSPGQPQPMFTRTQSPVTQPDPPKKQKLENEHPWSTMTPDELKAILSLTVPRRNK